MKDLSRETSMINSEFLQEYLDTRVERVFEGRQEKKKKKEQGERWLEVSLKSPGERDG